MDLTDKIRDALLTGVDLSYFLRDIEYRPQNLPTMGTAVCVKVDNTYDSWGDATTYRYVLKFSDAPGRFFSVTCVYDSWDYEHDITVSEVEEYTETVTLTKYRRI